MINKRLEAAPARMAPVKKINRHTVRVEQVHKRNFMDHVMDNLFHYVVWGIAAGTMIFAFWGVL